MRYIMHSKQSLLPCLAIALLLLTAIATQRAQAASLPQHIVSQHNTMKSLANEGNANFPAWAGYEAVNWNTYRQIDGEWNVVTAQKPDSSSYGDAAQWVGFNGDDVYEVPDDYQGPLVQVGTESAYGLHYANPGACLQGIPFNTPISTPEYYAWVEVIGDSNGHLSNNLFPDASGSYCGRYLFPVSPNDDIVASVNVPANSYVPGNSASCRQNGTTAFIAIQDKSTGAHWSTSFTNNAYNDPRDGMCAFSADWILERSGNDANTDVCLAGLDCFGILANFGTAHFYNCYLDTSGGNGFGITYFSYMADTMHRMTKPDTLKNPPIPTGNLLAEPGPLYNSGTAFDVSFYGSE